MNCHFITSSETSKYFIFPKNNFKDNFLYMVFEYMERRSLMELPTQNPLNEQLAWKYFRDTLKGLEYRNYSKNF